MIKRDCHSVTSSNLRNILLLSRKDDIGQLSRTDVQTMEYMPVTEPNRWKISVVHELIDVKWGEAVIEGFEDIELDAIIEELCTS